MLKGSFPYKLLAFIMIFLLVWFGCTQYFILSNSPAAEDNVEHDITQEAFEAPIDISSMEQDDPRLIKEIRRRFLKPPPPIGTPYFLKAPKTLDPSAGQAKAVLKILSNMTNGFFIESGALDGEFLSNTLYMERIMGWQGLLVEPDPKFLNMIYPMQRHAWIAPVCLSPRTTPFYIMFNPEKVAGHGHIDTGIKSEIQLDKLYVQCIPLYSILLALNRTDVDYFSLDVEGAEIDILRTLPFDKLNIKVLTIEDGPRNAELIKLMADNGYEKAGFVGGGTVPAHDLIFVKNSLLNNNSKH